MSTAKKSKKRKTAPDQPVTVAERNRAIKYLQKQGGPHITRPVNGLVQDSPAQTIERCRGIIDWIAHIEQPFSGGALAAAEADVLHMVVDALEHAEKVVRSVGAQPDPLKVTTGGAS